MVLTTCPDAQQRMQQVLDRFEAEVRRFFDAATLQAGGYVAESRRGEPQFFTLPSLSIGVLPVLPRGFDSHRDVSAVLVDLKKAAKQLPGNRMFVDRRHHDPVPPQRAAAVMGAG